MFSFHNIWSFSNYLQESKCYSHPEKMGNKRTVSLLSSIASVISVIFLSQNNLQNPNQSGFKVEHFTDSAILAVIEILHAAESGNCHPFLSSSTSQQHLTLLSTFKSLGIHEAALNNWKIAHIRQHGRDRLQNYGI